MKKRFAVISVMSAMIISLTGCDSVMNKSLIEMYWERTNKSAHETTVPENPPATVSTDPARAPETIDYTESEDNTALITRVPENIIPEEKEECEIAVISLPVEVIKEDATTGIDLFRFSSEFNKTFDKTSDYEWRSFENPFAEISSTHYIDELTENYSEIYADIYKAYLYMACTGENTLVVKKGSKYDFDDINEFAHIYRMIAADVPVIDANTIFTARRAGDYIVIGLPGFTIRKGDIFNNYNRILKIADYLKGDYNRDEFAERVNQYLIGALESDTTISDGYESVLSNAFTRNVGICDSYASIFNGVMCANGFDCFSVISENHEFSCLPDEYGCTYTDTYNNDNNNMPELFFMTTLEAIPCTEGIPEIMLNSLPDR